MAYGVLCKQVVKFLEMSCKKLLGLIPEMMSKLVLAREYDFQVKLVDRLEA